MDEIPDESDHTVVNTTVERLLLYADSDNSGKWAWVSDQPIGDNRPNWANPALRFYWDGTQRPNYTLTMRRYWRQVPGTHTHVLPGGGFQKAYSTTHGISQTDSEAISAELGIDAGGLSAKLTATFEHSVTTSSENSEMTTFTAGAPEAGFTRVWLIWQLVDELVALDPSNKIMPEGGFGKGDVWWAGPFLGPSGANLLLKKTRQIFPTETYVPDQKDFPSSAAT
jgi:hypothetical protein